MIIKHWQGLTVKELYFYFWYLEYIFSDNTYFHLSKFLNAGLLLIAGYYHSVL